MSCQEDHRQLLGSGSHLKRTSREAFPNLVTPDRIPEFIIPSLDILKEHQVWRKETGLPRSFQEHEAPMERTNPSPQDECCSFWPDPLTMDAKVCDVPDPVVRAALSLPHLPKITTPYGFVSLGQSPHVTKEEALFFQLGPTNQRDLSPKRHPKLQGGHRYCGHKERTLVAHTDANLKGPVDRSCLSSGSSGETGSQQELRFSEAVAAGNEDTPLKPSGALATAFSLEKPKRNLFQKILKKHFAHLGHLKTVRLPAH